MSSRGYGEVSPNLIVHVRMTALLCRTSRGSSQRQAPAEVRSRDGSAASQLFESCRATRAGVAVVAAAARPLPSALKRSANADLAALVRQRKRKCVEMRRTGVFTHDSDDSLIIAAAADVRER